jgi:general secretion pathway protein D
MQTIVRTLVNTKCIGLSVRFLGAALFLAFLGGQSAQADDDIVVKPYATPQGQATAAAEKVKNEFGIIPGVHVAADERIARVIVTAPPQVQSQIAQRFATAFPELNAAAENSTTAAAKTRQIHLTRIQATEVESDLWKMLGNRLTALPADRPQVHSYRLATSGGGNVRVAIDTVAGQVKLEGAAAAVDAAARLVQILDLPPDPSGKNIRLMPLQPSEVASVKRAASLLRTPNGEPAVSMPLASMLLQARPDASANGATPPPPAPGAGTAQPGAAALPGGPAARPPDFGALSRIYNPVQLEVIEGLDMLVLRGSARDVEELINLVKYIEEITRQTEPAIEIMTLKYIECESMAVMVTNLYNEIYRERQGNVSITPLIVPNALLIVGRPENVKTVKDLVTRLDQPSIPGADYRVFHLTHVAAATALATLQSTFVQNGIGFAPAVRFSIDARINSVIVQAGARDMANVADLIRQLDVITPTPGVISVVKIIPLKHTLAADIANIMRGAIGQGAAAPAQPGGQPQGFNAPGAGPFGAPTAPGAPNAAAAAQSVQRIQMLRLNAKDHRLLQSGILTDVTIASDPRSNSVIITSPAENVELLEALVNDLDNLPAAQAQIKVFTIVNGDAQTLSNMLTTLFTGQATGTQGGPQALLQLIQASSSSGEASIVPLRFGVDPRTNSVIASGTVGDLNIVEAILTKLDDGEVRHRRSIVIRLKNAPAPDVATTITNFLTAERQLLQAAGPGVTTPFEQIEREVVVVGESVTNSLILSATPKYFEEMRGIIDQLDARPPMVMIQVLIASVELGDTNEFGIELGLQDSVLFDRSILSNLVTTSETTAAGATTTSVVAANSSPGFLFNNGGGLGNSGTLPASTGFPTATHPTDVAGQGIANFGTGTTNTKLGYSGLVLSAASQNVSALLRALAENHRVDILQRPTVTALDNQPAFVQVGQRVPRITGVTNNAVTGNINTITLDNIGLILGVTPRISPEGLVVMQIDAEKSELEPLTSGIPIFTSPTGQITYSPIIDATTAQTTVAAMSEQTVVIGGLITKSKQKEHHGVPVLDDIPVINNFFRYDSEINERTELLIIMTPHIIRNQADADALKRSEAAKMTWCLNDVTAMYGEAGLRRRCDQWSDSEVPVVYPDNGPAPVNPPAPEVIPAPKNLLQGPAGSSMQMPAPPSAGSPAYLAPAAPMPDAGPTDPVAAYRNAPVQQAQYQAAPQAAPAVQPAYYAPPAGQPYNTAQPAYYQAPAADASNRYAQPASDYRQQPSYDQVPPAYYPSQAAGQNR